LQFWYKIYKIRKCLYFNFIAFFFSGKVEVLMQVNTIPGIVISGSGENESDARESAARVILSYFKSVLNI